MSQIMSPGIGLAPNGWYQKWREGAPSYPELFADLPGHQQQAWIDFAEKANQMLEEKEQRIDRIREEYAKLAREAE